MQMQASQTPEDLIKLSLKRQEVMTRKLDKVLSLLSKSKNSEYDDNPELEQDIDEDPKYITVSDTQWRLL